MKKTNSIKLTIVLLLCTLICSCKMGPTDTELINTAMNNWKQAFIDQDIDAIMANYSEDFSSERIEGKEQMQDFLQRAIDDGWLENIDINLEIAQLTITDDTADFTPVEFIGDQGEMEIEFTLKKEDKKTWRIIESAPRR